MRFSRIVFAVLITSFVFMFTGCKFISKAASKAVNKAETASYQEAAERSIVQLKGIAKIISDAGSDCDKMGDGLEKINTAEELDKLFNDLKLAGELDEDDPVGKRVLDAISLIDPENDTMKSALECSEKNEKVSKYLEVLSDRMVELSKSF